MDNKELTTDITVTQPAPVEPHADTVPPVENTEPVEVQKPDVDNQNPEDTQVPAEPAETQTPSVEELQARLNEYELKEKERNELKQRLSITDDTPDELQLSTLEATVANRGQSEFISLCTKFGVDFTPEKIEASANALKERDPQAYYEFVYNADQLKARVDAEQNQIRTTKLNHEINTFYQANKPLIENSPVVNKIVETYIRENFDSMQNPTVELNNLVEGIKEIYIEALETGKLLAKKEAVQNDKSGLQTSIATDNTSTYSLQQGQTPFTREQIKRMSDSEYMKNEKVILQQAQAGLIK